MAIIVDKVQKRKDIALACKNILIENGIKDVTISKLTKTAGISKGSFYDYFENKEDIVFEIINILLEKHNIDKAKKIEAQKSTRDKIKAFFNVFYEDSEYEIRKIFGGFISIALTNPIKEIHIYKTKKHYEYLEWFKSIFRYAIDKKEIKSEALDLAEGLFIFGSGIYVTDATVNLNQNIKEIIDKHIDSIFDLIEL